MLAKKLTFKLLEFQILMNYIYVYDTYVETHKISIHK